MSLTRRYETDLLAHIDLDRPVEVRVIGSAHTKSRACAVFCVGRNGPGASVNTLLCSLVIWGIRSRTLNTRPRKSLLGRLMY